MIPTNLHRSFLSTIVLVWLEIIATAGSDYSDYSQQNAASEPCTSYAIILCEMAGAHTPTCGAVKMTTEVMAPDACQAGLKNIDYSARKLASLHQFCDELIHKVCERIGPNTETCQVFTEHGKQLPAERCKSMLQHVPEIVSTLNSMEQAVLPLTTDLQAAIADSPNTAFGPANAEIQIVEFSDFACPDCSRAAEVVRQIRQNYSDRVRFVFRQFPLPIYPNARAAAEAALTAASQGKFWEFHDRLFYNQRLDRTGLEEAAKHSGLDVNAFKKSLDEHKYAPVVDSDVKLGERARVQGTPTMFVNGVRFGNPMNFELVRSVIEDALNRARPE